MTTFNDITQLLLDWRAGDRAALDKLTPLVYRELRQLAKGYLRRERQDHTLQATALVHEAYLELVDQSRVNWQNRAHFFGVAAKLMRRILVDHARAHRAEKRGGGKTELPLDDAKATPGGRPPDIIALDQALQDLAKIDERKSRIIELRYFGGLSMEDTAEVAGISVATVRRELRLAETWLYGQMKKS